MHAEIHADKGLCKLETCYMHYCKKVIGTLHIQYCHPEGSDAEGLHAMQFTNLIPLSFPSCLCLVSFPDPEG